MEAGEPVSEPADWQPLVDAAAQAVKALFDFMQEIQPEGGIIGPPYVHRLGPTWWPEFTVQGTLPRCEPPRLAFGTVVTPVEPYPVKTKTQEIPEAFRRR